MYDYLIVGAGLSGATIAHLAAKDGKQVLVIDKRGHLGGNVYDTIDPQTGIRISLYGAHLFHTNDKEVWSFVQQFGTWKRWDHTVVADVSGIYVPVPVNPITVNSLCGTSISTEAEMNEWLTRETVPCETSVTSKDVALSRVGKRLYETLFRDYTIKQWNKSPEDLDPSVLARIPVRTSFDCRYFNDKFQGLPVEGYTHIVEQMLNHPNITVQLNTSWETIADSAKSLANTLVFTGPIDTYFQHSGLAPLEYRSIEFSWERIPCCGYIQPNSVVNYPLASVPFTRCVEYKHFLHQQSDWTILAKEKTTDKGEPYYPVPTEANQDLYSKYVELANQEQGVHFIGRLANYKYFNMDQAIRNAMDYYRAHLA
jgi:UDP-galactopyranose mutase